MEPNDKTLTDYMDALKRRKWSIIIPVLTSAIVAAVIAVTLPPIYKSEATILIEEQEIPPDYVMTTVTSFAEKRLRTITQRIMSFSRLLEIIERFELYPELRKKRTKEELVEKIREDIQFGTISAEVVDQRTGRPTRATIAFTLSYKGKDQTLAQRVASVLTSLYLEENLQVRERQAQETSKFLEEEMAEVKAYLAELDAKIATFKEKHLDTLPELLQANLQGLDRTERDIERSNDRLATLKDLEVYLQTQLASMPREEADQDKERLADLKMQLVHLESRFSDEHPDVIKTRAEISELEKHIEASSSAGDGREPPGSGDTQAGNPAYTTTASHLASTQREIESIKRQAGNLEKERDEYRRRVEATPRVEEEYKALFMERNNTQAKFNDLMAKVLEARVAHGLEKEQKGERFTVVDPARFPEKPDNNLTRLAVFLIGMVLGLVTGVGTASLREYTDDSVRTAEGLMSATSSPVLVTLPEIVTARDRALRRVKRMVILLGVFVVIVGGVLAFHFLVMDLNVFWAKLARRVALMDLFP